MKGLLLDYLYKSLKTTDLPLLIMVILGICLSIYPDNSIILCFVLIFSTVVPLLVLQVFSNDEILHWDRYALMFPINPKHVILVKYLFTAIWTLLTCFVILFFLLLTTFVHTSLFFDLGYKDIATILMLSFAQNLNLYAFSFFLTYGPLRVNRLYRTAASCITSCATILFKVYAINSNNIAWTAGMLFIFITAIGIFEISFFYSKRFYPKTEF